MKLISLNIETDKHLGTVTKLLTEECPDVVCLQEILEKDVKEIEAVLGMQSVYLPLCLWPMPSGAWEPWGVAIFAKEIAGVQAHHFAEQSLPQHIRENPETINYGILKARVNGSLNIATTHFTWSRLGLASDLQRRNLAKLFSFLDELPDFILCGDMNAPRGGEIFNSIADKYKDWIPQEYRTSIDGNLHRAGALELMVDGLFSTPQYIAKNVRLISGVSDHCAILAEIQHA
jgi:endonuclease/exonuclease/phosphatase family metal-dependent hydrolase